MAGERHGNGIGAAWTRHAMCESAFTEHAPRGTIQSFVSLQQVIHLVDGGF